MDKIYNFIDNSNNKVKISRYSPIETSQSSSTRWY